METPNLLCVDATTSASDSQYFFRAIMLKSKELLIREDAWFESLRQAVVTSDTHATIPSSSNKFDL
jgi:hypothetical protein